MGNDLTKNFVLDTFNEVIIGAGVPASTTFPGPQIEEYGESIHDEFIGTLIAYCSPSGDPFIADLQDDDYDKLINIINEIETSLSADDLTIRGIPEDYFDLVKEFVKYAVERIEGGG